MRAVSCASRGEEECAGGVCLARLLPFTRKDENGLVGFRMYMRGYGDAGLKPAQHSQPTGLFILVQDHQIDSWVRTSLPGFLFGYRNVREHDLMETAFTEIARTFRTFVLERRLL